MKNLKPFIAVSMASLFFAMNTFAAPTKVASKTMSKKETAAEVNSVSQAVLIDVEDRQLMIDNNGQALVVFKYVITNTGNKPISNIQWISAYVSKREIIHSQNMQLELESTLMPSKSLTINLQIPFVQIEEKFRPIFTDSQSKIDVYSIDRVVRFNDKKELHER
ncbi:hypothetical protein [Rodentibacter genomosp. 2]|uniref:DUF2393 domain-containing protein n=1 Tax=Rodentibacter genomosp. 2 TaxID=1908266 RepID=A0A1V3JLG0_9PAST|nr:hypothetical protein [Rodentibacter genomosp. 2]OOF57666.1 hypothetical protein BKK55_03990 [Rodentibacter genomosp. 2]